jgi:DNA-binding CsgD family transcriptional regulator
LGDLEVAWGYAAAELKRVEERRDRFSLVQALHGNSLLAHLQGDWQTARDFSDRALAVDYQDVRLLHNRAILEYQQGEFGEGAHYLERLVETMRLSPLEPNWEHLTAPMTIGMAACISGTDSHFDDALAAAEVMLSAPNVLPFHAQGVRTGLALLAVHRGDVASAGEQYAALKPWPITMTLMNLVCGHRVLGLLARTIGLLPRAMDHFEKALAFCRKAGCQPELAWTCHDYAEALLQCASTSSARTSSGNQEKAVSLLNEALSISQKLGMKPLMERVQTLQQKLEAPPAPTPVYPDGLTRREVEVLRLIAAGRSNREIAQELTISPNTVLHHVSNILSKTGVHNRAEAATYAARHGLVSL